MRKALFIISVLVLLISLSQLVYAGEFIDIEDEGTDYDRYKLYFEDDFSTNKNWFIAYCEDPNFDGEFEFCGIDEELKAYRISGFEDVDDIENLLLFLKYDKQEFGDKLEFDINLIEIGGICDLHFMVAGEVYEFNTIGAYHYKTIIDRSYDETYLKLPDGSTIHNKERLASWTQISEFAGTTIDNIEGNRCTINFSVDNIKIYKKHNSGWILFDELIKKVEYLWEKVFG